MLAVRKCSFYGLYKGRAARVTGGLNKGLNKGYKVAPLNFFERFSLP